MLRLWRWDPGIWARDTHACKREKPFIHECPGGEERESHFPFSCELEQKLLEPFIHRLIHLPVCSLICPRSDSAGAPRWSLSLSPGPCPDCLLQHRPQSFYGSLLLTRLKCRLLSMESKVTIWSLPARSQPSPAAPHLPLSKLQQYWSFKDTPKIQFVLSPCFLCMVPCLLDVLLPQLISTVRYCPDTTSVNLKGVWILGLPNSLEGTDLT